MAVSNSLAIFVASSSFLCSILQAKHVLWMHLPRGLLVSKVPLIFRNLLFHSSTETIFGCLLIYQIGGVVEKLFGPRKFAVCSYPHV